MRWLGGTTPEGRADLPDVLAREGVPGDGVRMRSSATRLDAMTAGCPSRDGVRGPFLRFHSHQDGGRMRAVGMAFAGVPGADLSKQWMRSLR